MKKHPTKESLVRTLWLQGRLTRDECRILLDEEPVGPEHGGNARFSATARAMYKAVQNPAAKSSPMQALAWLNGPYGGPFLYVLSVALSFVCLLLLDYLEIWP
jgi:hypothetical protein